MSRHAHIASVEQIRHYEASDPEDFDRMAFAFEALDVLRPPGLTVAVYLRQAGFHVEAMPDLRGGEGARWAIVGLPPRAGRAQIARVIADLAGVADVPFAVDLLVHAGRSPA